MEAVANIIEWGTVKVKNPLGSNDAERSIWLDFVEKADTYNQPGRFTAMNGFEWTFIPKGDNLHRVVIIADGFEKTSQTHPYSIFDSQDPQDLWAYPATAACPWAGI